jgi:hypothetical protein
MRNFLQAQGLADIGPVLHDGHDAAMVELEKSPKDHQGKELVLRVILAAAPAGVSGESVRGDLDGLPGQRHR